MSLKAKIEAVIYAADEPVTLAQLAAIFGDEVLATKSEASLPFGTAMPESSESADLDRPAAAVSPAPEEDPQPETAEAAQQPVLPMEDAEAKKQARFREREARLAIQKIVDELIAEYEIGRASCRERV